MTGTIRTYQKCPKCGDPFGSSNGIDGTILCKNGCMTQPTKFFIRVKSTNIYCDKEGAKIHDFVAALALIGGIRDEIKRGVFDPEAYRKQSKTTFNKFWERFQDQYKGKIGTYDKLKAVNNHLQFFNDMQVREIRAYHISDWWNELREKDLSPKYRNDILQWLIRFFKMAYAEDIIDDLPRRFPTPDPIPEPEVEDWLSLEEQLKILDALPVHDRPIFDFLFLSGCRVNEACALQRTDINWQKEKVFLNNTVKRDGSIGIVKSKKRRVINITPDIENCLKAALKRASFNPYVFINNWGRRYSDDYLRDTLNKVCKKEIGRVVKLKNSTRHSLGMRLAVLGYTMDQIKEVLNHSNTRITKHYASIQDDRYSEVYCRIPIDPDKRSKKK